jgi:hypothetical protein
MSDQTLKITQVTVTFGGTINIGNYQNTRIETTLSAEVGEGQFAASVHQRLFEAARDMTVEAARGMAARRVADYWIDSVMPDGVHTDEASKEDGDIIPY